MIGPCCTGKVNYTRAFFSPPYTQSFFFSSRNRDSFIQYVVCSFCLHSFDFVFYTRNTLSAQNTVHSFDFLPICVCCCSDIQVQIGGLMYGKHPEPWNRCHLELRWRVHPSTQLKSGDLGFRFWLDPRLPFGLEQISWLICIFKFVFTFAFSLWNQTRCHAWHFWIKNLNVILT